MRNTWRSVWVQSKNINSWSLLVKKNDAVWFKPLIIYIYLVFSSCSEMTHPQFYDFVFSNIWNLCVNVFLTMWTTSFKLFFYRTCVGNTQVHVLSISHWCVLKFKTLTLCFNKTKKHLELIFEVMKSLHCSCVFRCSFIQSYCSDQQSTSVSLLPFPSLYLTLSLSPCVSLHLPCICPPWLVKRLEEQPISVPRRDP